MTRIISQHRLEVTSFQSVELKLNLLFAVSVSFCAMLKFLVPLNSLLLVALSAHFCEFLVLLLCPRKARISRLAGRRSIVAAATEASPPTRG